MPRTKSRKPLKRAKTPIDDKSQYSPRLRLSWARITGLILFLLFAVGALVRCWHVHDVAHRTPDEIICTRYARRILEKGLGQYPVMVQEYNQDRAMQLYPPPMRVGYLTLLAGAMKVSGVSDERAGAWLSCFLSIASLALIGLIGTRFLPPWAAIYGMLYLALSVPDLVIARRCWQDALMGFLGMLMVWSACEIKRAGAKWWSYVTLIGAGSYSVLVKESGAFVYGGCALYLFITLFRRRDWKAAAVLALGGLLGAGLSSYCLMSAAGGFAALLTTWKHLTALLSPEALSWSSYSSYQSGPWYQFIWGLWILSPANLVLAVVAVSLSLLPDNILKRLLLFLPPIYISLLRLFSWLTVLIVMTLLLTPNTQCFRYMSPVYGAMYLLGGMGLWAVLRFAAGHFYDVAYRTVGILGVAVVLYGAVAGYRDFRRVYVEMAVPDMPIKFVIDTRNSE